MKGRLRRHLVVGLVAVPVFVPAAVSAAGVRAAGGDKGGYHGWTSQGRAISFHVSGHQLTGLRFAVNVVCPSRHVWKVSAAVSMPVKIINSRFDQSFKSQVPGASGTATVKGRMEGGVVTGTLSMRRYIAPEHHYCSGSATFTLRRTPRRRAGTLDTVSTGDLPGSAVFARSSRRYYDAR